MKIIAIITIILIFFSSCSHTNTNTQSNINTTSPKNETIDFTNAPFSINTENQAAFWIIAKDNPIDEKYRNRDTDVTKLSENEAEYIDIWLEELRNSCESLKKLLNEEDKLAFEVLQNQWYKEINNKYSFQAKITRTEEYGVDLGTISDYELASSHREEVRQRTFWVKYLQYCIMYCNKELEYDIPEAVEFFYSEKA